MRGNEEIPAAVPRACELRLPPHVWGLRTIGIITSVISCAIAAARFYQLYRATGEVGEETAESVRSCARVPPSLDIPVLVGLGSHSSRCLRERLAETLDTIGGKTSAKKNPDLR